MPVTANSLFPVASITKLATALGVLRLVQRGVVELDAPLSQFAPEARAAQVGVKIRTLLCHTAGLPLDLPNGDELYGKPLSWNELAAKCLNVELAAPPGTRVLYSNVGYGLLARVAERISRSAFADFLSSAVLEPLGIEGYLGREPPRAPMQLADVRSRHAGTELEPYNSRYYRTLGLPWSGLVMTAEGALRLVRAYAGDPEDFLSQGVRQEATRNQTDDLPGGYGGKFMYPRSPWGLGVDLRGDKKPHWTPSNASPQTFGHAGASGCVVWHDPLAGVSWAIVGTRTADNAWLVHGSTRIATAILDWRGVSIQQSPLSQSGRGARG